MRAAKAQTSLRVCADSSEPSLLDNAISTKILCFHTLRFGTPCMKIVLLYVIQVTGEDQVRLTICAFEQSR